MRKGLSRKNVGANEGGRALLGPLSTATHRGLHTPLYRAGGPQPQGSHCSGVPASTGHQGSSAQTAALPVTGETTSPSHACGWHHRRETQPVPVSRQTHVLASALFLTVYFLALFQSQRLVTTEKWTSDPTSSTRL